MGLSTAEWMTSHCAFVNSQSGFCVLNFDLDSTECTVLRPMTSNKYVLLVIE